LYVNSFLEPEIGQKKTDTRESPFQRNSKIKKYKTTPRSLLMEENKLYNCVLFWVLY